MRYSKKLPTKPGFYGWRDPGAPDYEPVAVKVFSRAGHLIDESSDMRVEEVGGLWTAPLVPERPERKAAKAQRLPGGISRADGLAALRELREMAVAAEKLKDPCFKCWPDLDALLDHIAQHGFPAPALADP